MYNCHDIPLALRPRPLTAIFLWPCGLAPSRQYSFGLAALPPHGNIPSALWPRPLTVIFLRPCGLPPSRQYSFGLVATPPHGEINFLFASWRMSILFFSRPLTAKSIFYSPHGECRFSICLTANVDFIFLTPPHGEIDFLFASR